MTLDEMRTLAQVYQEMNAIRARDGVPYCHDGRKSSVCPDYWDRLVDRLDVLIERHTGKQAHCNPALYLRGD